MGYRIAVIGATGNVGQELLTTLAEHGFPAEDIVALASSASIGREASYGEDDVLKVRDVAAYVAGTGALSEDETIDERTAMGEFVFMGLRTANGISAARFAELFGEGIDERFSGEIVRLVSDGLLLREGDRMKLTEKGVELSNQAFAMFV